MGFCLFWEGHSINSVIISCDRLIKSLSLQYDDYLTSQVEAEWSWCHSMGFTTAHSWNTRVSTFWREYTGSHTRVFMHITTRACKCLHVSELNRKHFLLAKRTLSIYSGGLDKSHRTKWHKAVAAHVSHKYIFTSIWQKMLSLIWFSQLWCPVFLSMCFKAELTVLKFRT